MGCFNTSFFFVIVVAFFDYFMDIKAFKVDLFEELIIALVKSDIAEEKFVFGFLRELSGSPSDSDSLFLT